MKYPNGQLVRMGDIIWTNEGVNVRKVIRTITEKDEEFTIFGESGILWSRYLGAGYLGSDGMPGFEALADFENEGIEPLSMVEVAFIRLLFSLLERQISIRVWDNPSYLCYPVTRIVPENEKLISKWFLFIQAYPYNGQFRGYQDEECYLFHEGTLTFEKIGRDKRNFIRGI